MVIVVDFVYAIFLISLSVSRLVRNQNIGYSRFPVCFLKTSGLSFGGKDSTEFVIKGSHKEVPEELIDELKSICQVLYFFSFYVNV